MFILIYIIQDAKIEMQKMLDISPEIFINIIVAPKR